MNFAANRQGFYEDDSRGIRPFSQSSTSSSSSSSQLKGLVPLSHHQQQQLQRRGGWDETTFRCYSGGGASQFDLALDSSSPSNMNNSGDDADESEENTLLRRGGGDSSKVPGTGSAMVIEREHMFDKVVTPSDVGKLNRLVIPKQHAEKYFPLDSSTNEKGLLLNFEDRNGKPWRFRYSYWNSSQSYVMTKGWSRFVKEKKLDAGDIVSFHRGVGELGKDRLFIDWRRRPDAPDHHHHQLPPPIPALSLPHHFSFHPWNHPYYLQRQAAPPPLGDPSQFLQVNAINSRQPNPHSYDYSTAMSGKPSPGSVVYLRSAAGGIAGAAAAASPQGVGIGMVQVQRDGRERGIQEPMVFESVPVVQGKAAAKRLRLFGVNMECPISESDDECDLLSSTAVPNFTTPAQPSQSQSRLSSSSLLPTLQLRPYGGAPVLQTLPSDLLNKGKASTSLDFDV